MRNRLVLMIGVAVVFFAAGTIVAGGRSGPNGGDPAIRTTRAVPTADARYARAAAVVANDPVRFVTKKGFTKLTHPAVGVYCLKLKDTTLKPGKLVPQVTVEWGTSFGSDLLAHVLRTADDCPRRALDRGHDVR
jgi:hypothetical protein